MVNILLNNVPFIDIVVLSKSRFSYIPRTLVNSYTLVEVMDSLHSSHWEVWKLRKGSRGKSFNVWNVIFPANSEFGYYGWSFESRGSAERKMSSLLESDV